MFAASLPTILIVFREVLEAALIVSIILAATRGIPERGRWIGLGIAGGTVGAAIVAALTTQLAAMFGGSGQEIVNAGILFIAAALIGWHVVWMNHHGKQMVKDMRGVCAEVREGSKDLSVLAIVVGLAIMREGSEVVLMLQGLWVSGAASTMLLGGLLGFAAGALAGCMLYFGFVALPVGRIFSLTNGLLVLIASGMAARGANFLAQADLLPSFGNRLWDSSRFLAEDSAVGQVLAALVGYIARPNGLEVLAYLLTLIIIVTLMHKTAQDHGKRHQPAVAAGG